MAQDKAMSISAWKREDAQREASLQRVVFLCLLMSAMILCGFLAVVVVSEAGVCTLCILRHRG